MLSYKIVHHKFSFKKDEFNFPRHCEALATTSNLRLMITKLGDLVETLPHICLYVCSFQLDLNRLIQSLY